VKVLERNFRLMISLQIEFHVTKINGGSMLKVWKKILSQIRFSAMIHEEKEMMEDLCEDRRI